MSKENILNDKLYNVLHNDTQSYIICDSPTQDKRQVIDKNDFVLLAFLAYDMI